MSIFPFFFFDSACSPSWSAKSYLNEHTSAWGLGLHVQQWGVIFTFTEPCLAPKLTALKLKFMESYRFSALLKHFKTSRLLLWDQDLRAKFLGQAPVMGFNWASIEQGFSSGLRTPKWRCLEAHLGPHLPLCFMESYSTDFSLWDTGGTAQLRKIRHLVLLEMSCGVWDILIQWPA